MSPLACGAVAISLAVSVAGCERPAHPVTTTWRADCVARERPAPFSLPAAREAHRMAARRHDLRVREAAVPGSFMRTINAVVDAERMARGEVCLEEVAEAGRLLFEHEYGFVDGLGADGAAQAPAGPFRRVHTGLVGGPETLSCPSCHWVGGPNGAGAETDNAFLQGDGDHFGSGDERNPPALVGLGVVRALAREMTRELQEQRAALVRDATRAGADRETQLRAKGVDFGVLRAGADGRIDAGGLEGVDPDLVVKPFGWKGSLPEIGDFAADALQVHMGMQSERALAIAAGDATGASAYYGERDGHGVRDEMRPGPFTAMTLHLALGELPIAEPLIQRDEIEAAAPALFPTRSVSFVEDFRRGRQRFHDLGCAGCHRPMLVLENPVLELDGLPPIDLTRAMRSPGLRYDAAVGGYPVWLFSDLKRHDMGEQNAAQHVQRGVRRREYLTPRLWGAADSAPYLHDGRAPSFDYAIAGHDGDGARARDAFAALSREEKGDVRVYLMSLRRAPQVFVP